MRRLAVDIPEEFLDGISEIVVSPRTVAQEEASGRLAVLTPRERAVMDLVVDGLANKNIAVKLNISQRTVEAHRAAVMKRTGAGSLADLIRLVMQAA